MTYTEKIGGCLFCHAEKAHRRGDRTVRFECGSYIGPQSGALIQSPECHIAVEAGGWDEYREAQHASQ